MTATASAPPTPRPARATVPNPALGRSANFGGRRGRSALPAEAALAIIALGAAACIALWWRNTPSISGFGDWVTNAGRITGLLAGYAVVVLLALMARIPWLERGLGADRLARWHSMGGRYTVSLVVAHALLITWGYAITAHTNVVSQTKTFLLSYPDVLAASVAGLLLLGVGLVSARAARTRMHYETWYYLHLYTYLAVALAFSHQFANGAEFIDNRAARVWWSSMYIAVGLALLWFRVLTPIRQALRHRLRVTAVVPEANGVVSVVITGDSVRELQAQAGQFFRWRFLTRQLWWVSSPYSLSAPVIDGHLRITVKAAGEHSAELARLRPGTKVLAEGPYGRMTGDRRSRRKVLLVAGGVGITPLRALFQTLPGGPGDITLVYRASNDNDVVFRHELETIAAQRGSRVHFVTGSRRELGGDPLSRAVLQANVPDLARHDVYVCGPPGMTARVVASLRSAGVSRRRIHTESFEF